MISKLQKAEGGVRVLQLLLVGLFFIFWIYLRVNGFGTKWDSAPAGAEMYGTILFALGVIASLWALATASAGMAYVVRTHYAQHGLGFHLGRWGLEFVTIWLFAGLRIMITLIPSNYLPELTQTSKRGAEPTFSQIKSIAYVGIIIVVFAFVGTHWLVLVQAFLSRRERKRNHNFGKLDGEALGSAAYLTTQAATYGESSAQKPSFSYSGQAPPSQGFSSPSIGAFHQPSYGAAPAQPQPAAAAAMHQQQPSWGASTQASLPPLPQQQQTTTYGGYQPGYAKPGVVDPPSLSPSHAQSQQNLPIYPGQMPQQQYVQQPQPYAQPQPAQYHQRDPSYGSSTVYAQGNNRF